MSFTKTAKGEEGAVEGAVARRRTRQEDLTRDHEPFSGWGTRRDGLAMEEKGMRLN